MGTPGLSGDSGLRDSQRGGGPPIWFSVHQLKPGSESPSALTAPRWVPSGPISAVTRPNILQAVHPAQVLHLQPPVWPGVATCPSLGKERKGKRCVGFCICPQPRWQQLWQPPWATR